MSTSTLIQIDSVRSAGWWGRITDYVELAKPRILTMVLITVALSGIVATWGQPDFAALLHTVVGTAFVAGSASILNQWLERDTDRLMRRTENRSLASGRLSSAETLAVGMISVLLGLAYLLNLSTHAAAIWASVTWLLYVGVYTPMKRRSSFNTVVGAVPGALPVLIGWTGAGATLDTRAACLFLLVFFWQFPHFMAIAWIYRHQYADAGMKMLPVVDPTGRRAGNQAIIAAVAVLAVSLTPAALAVGVSWIYLTFSAVLGLGQLRCAWHFAQVQNDRNARRLLRASLIYLPLQLVLVTLLNLAII